jgi:hypothetical protein
MIRSLCLAAFVGLLACAPLPAQDKPAAPATPDKETLHKQFTEQLSNAKLVGRFTLIGKEDEYAIKEEFSICSV